jgi:hypothetical protein
VALPPDRVTGLGRDAAYGLVDDSVTNRVGLFRDACLNLIGCLGHFKVTTYCSRERINNYELETPAGVCGASDPTRAGATAERAARCSATARFRGSGKSAGDSPDKPRANPAEQSSTAKDARGQWVHTGGGSRAAVH